MFKDYVLKESAEYSTMENNPFIYILIIPYLLKLGEKECKKNKILKKAVDYTEKVLKDIPKKILTQMEKDFKPYPIMEMFKLNNDSKAVFDNYYVDLKNYVCHSCDTFTQVLELDKKLVEMYHSSEYENFKNNI